MKTKVSGKMSLFNGNITLRNIKGLNVSKHADNLVIP